MDVMVKAAQAWLNAEYAPRSAPWVPVAEDGITGWKTMYAIVRGLQIELGLSPDGSFGPGTQAAVDARGGIKPSDVPSMIKLVQSACYAKGYSAGYIDGNWGPVLATGLQAVRTNMFGPSLPGAGGEFYGPLVGKFVRALMNMDAYVLTAGGQRVIRECQQWLNATYWERSWYLIAPCDGHYSRDVQKALVKAIQEKIGATIDGLYGAGMRAALARNTVSPGASGRLVQLLSAACVFNGPVPQNTDDAMLNEQHLRAPFVATYASESDLVRYISFFQAFAFPNHPTRGPQPAYVPGVVDVNTWSELLFSCGEPGRAAFACDRRTPIASAEEAKALAPNYDIVGRYIMDWPSSTLPTKQMTPAEISYIHDAGMAIAPIWQWDGRYVENFTYATGLEHARLAAKRMEELEFGAGVVIIFAVDYDATDANIESNILPYFRGVRAALVEGGNRYRFGVYGTRNVCARVSDALWATISMVAGMSWGYSGNLGYPLPTNWALNQIQELKTAVPPIDRDVYRPRVYTGARPQDMNHDASDPAPAFAAHAQWLFRELEAGGDADPAMRTLEIYRSPEYATSDWDIVLRTDTTLLKANYGAYFSAKVLEFDVPEFVVSAKTDHIAASASGVLLEGPGASRHFTLGDLTGWGGDVISLYVAWMRVEDMYASGSEFVSERMAKRGVQTPMALNDYIEDIDGYLIARAVYERRANLGYAISAYYAGDAARRFAVFFAQRFGNDPEIARAAVTGWLTGDDLGFTWTPAALTFNRALLFQEMTAQSVKVLLTPGDLPGYKLAPFVDAVVARMQELASR